MFKMIEEPCPGLDYILAADPASLDQTKSKDPDKHSVVVVRKAYLDTNGRWWPHKLVARTIYECRWDGDIISDQIYRLSCFYGGCKIVVEANNTGQGVIRDLKAMGAPLYMRNIDDQKGDVRMPKPTGAYGFLTTGGAYEGCRGYVLDNLKKHVRELETHGLGIEVDCEDMVKEMKTFIRNPKGRPEAAEGKHDDDVMALAIAIFLADGHATRYVPPTMQKELPRDLQIVESLTKRTSRKSQWG
jgi:phage terminase large subunit